MIKKTGNSENKIDKDYWICKGENCGRKVTSLFQTTIGMRCLQCVINNNLTFLAEGEPFKKWAPNVQWFKGEEEIIELK